MRGSGSSRTFDHKGDADLFDAEVRRRKQLGPALIRELDRGVMTLEEFVRTGFRTHTDTLSAKTRRHYAWAPELHLAELLDEPLVALDVPRLAAHQRHLLDTGRTANTVREAMTQLSGVLQIAVEHGHIPGNPVRALRKVPAAPREEVRPLAPVELEALIASLTGRSRASVILGGHLGLRPIEIRAAAWRSLAGDTFTVGRARTKRSAARTRTIKVPATTLRELKAWRLEAGRPSDDEPIIGATTASALNQWGWKTLRPAAERACGRDDVSLYTLRHSHASACHYAGFTVPAAARRLGHGPALHIRTYAHVIDAIDGQHYEDLDALIRTARDALNGGAGVPRTLPDTGR